MRKNWTDDRLDHLNYKVDEGFRRMDIQSAQVNARLDRLESKFDRLTQGLIVAFCSLFGTMILSFGGIVASQL